MSFGGEQDERLIKPEERDSLDPSQIDIGRVKDADSDGDSD